MHWWGSGADLDGTDTVGGAVGESSRGKKWKRGTGRG